jgi:hypothetical protein
MAQNDRPDPPTWGRRPYADTEARELLNNLSDRIARHPPDHVDDPGDLTLSDVLRERYRQDTGDDAHAVTLAGMMKHGLSFEEVVCWYFYRFADYDLTEIHTALQGAPPGDHPAHRRNSLRNIQRILKSAATQLPREHPADVPNVIDAEADLEPAAQG